MDSMQTTETFQVLKMGADAYIKRRNQRLLSNHRKELRKFTRAEAFTYLDIDAKHLINMYLQQILIQGGMKILNG